MNNKKNQKLFFWSVILICLLLSVGQTPTASTETASSDLIINEFVAVNGTGLTDEEGEYSDWIEIYNRSNTAINLAGWALTDDPDQPQKWPFPDITLASHTYLVIFASGKDRRLIEPGAALHTNFKLDREGDFLALYNVLEDRLMDVLTPQFPEQFRDISYGRQGDELAYAYLTLPTPGGPNDETRFWSGIVSPVEFNANRGFYEEPFTLKLITATPGAIIRYTTDGSEPTESNGTLYTEPIRVEATTLLRAAAFEPNLLPSAVETQSYIFLDNVLVQSSTPPGFPLSWGARLTTNSNGDTAVAPMAADYEVDATIVNDPRYQETIEEDLKSLPVMSLVMPGQSFAELHAHFDRHGDLDLEHPISVELIHPAGNQPGFQVNAGIELQSDSGPEGPGPKHSFRLLFKREYGSTKLEYPLFPDSPVDEFDTLVLQANDVSEPTSYTREPWLYASHKAITGLGPSTLQVHLYLNGLYWGLYNVVERPDASFMAAYLGGQKEDWFIANQNGSLKQDLANQTDRLEYLFTTLSLVGHFDDGLESQEELAEKYAEVASYLNPVQFSDTMILNWYSQLLGWPENKGHIAINRQDPWGRGQYFIWNAQKTFNQADAQLDTNGTDSPSFNLINPIFETLLQDPDFRMQLADRMYKHLANDGSLTDTNAQARWQHLSNTINQAMIGESARWGDASHEPPLTQADWLKASDTVVAQMNGHAARLIAWAREVGYYPELDPPQFSQEGGLVKAGFTLTMSLPTTSVKESRIYYTIDGSDPRMPVTGKVAPTAVVYNAPVALTTNAPVKARVWLGDSSSNSAGTWSALHEATFSVMQQNHSLRITEIMYNPAEGDDYEFIELRNRGSNPIELANVSIDEGVSFVFPPNAPALPAGGTVVLVSNPTTFAERYPNVAVSGAYEGHLSNKGEKILVTDAVGEPLVEFEYDDANGWPVSADGRGDSLILIELDGDPNDPRNWRASLNLNGSPGTDEAIAGAGQDKG